jgi:hypothetical protein
MTYGLTPRISRVAVKCKVAIAIVYKRVSDECYEKSCRSKAHRRGHAHNDWFCQCLTDGVESGTVFELVEGEVADSLVFVGGAKAVLYAASDSG